MLRREDRGLMSLYVKMARPNELTAFFKYISEAKGSVPAMIQKGC
jgi:hypothetical protein